MGLLTENWTDLRLEKLARKCEKCNELSVST